MKRIALAVIRSLFQLPYWWFVKVKKLSNHDKYSLSDAYAFIHKIVFTITRRCRVTLECYGLENLPKEDGYLLTPNHQGLFDPLAIFQTHEKPIRAIVKKELASTILVKDVINMLQYVPMDRSNIRESAKVIKYVADEISRGQNFFVFPEGTRSKKQNEILDFKGGTFKIATKSKAPIVPVAMIDCYKVFDNNTIKKTTAQIHYLKPLYYDEYKDMKTNEIAQCVHDRIQECIRENQKG
ncbi:MULTISPECIES: 1-acyl-sn-glycerol-3-phosphate acyltransferase [Coprobacillaceae]|uniref:lysophospholipid acyltransferase family protein n=1 Tax=Coprobacillaceae TaxID=2810280 RepID=UPI000E4A381C|nr:MULTISPECIES: lysophospholipid acyltransferase family protein [Coprobacillaceae]RHM60576.1 1-acyl-sn-glycerol-3-phosphate acyltransferase [Coprobacillus sp. AF33-1AC]RHS93318.1 1-acyl-sn-glycerol-3-phosphate acyltransferase [Erysipelatoclostridium sp. AM42-17]